MSWLFVHFPREQGVADKGLYFRGGDGRMGGIFMDEGLCLFAT